MKRTILILSFIAAAYILNAQSLYGTTSKGGNNNSGAICKLVIATNTLTAPFSFDAPDGGFPLYSKLLQASDGKLYGMTTYGGSHGVGTMFSYDPADSAYTQLKGFDDSSGSYPYGSLVQASDGKLYGMTREGGSNNYGVIFSYDIVTSTYTKLVDFDGAKGRYPYGSLVQASDGKLYGMTWSGGSAGYGVIFSYDPVASAYTKLIDFDDDINGASPRGSLIQASDGNLYGMTGGGGGTGYGVIFSYAPGTSIYTKLVDFDGTNGSDPYGSLVQASDDKLYGMTSGGGQNGYGIIFSFNPATSAYTKLIDFDDTNGSSPHGDLVQASDGKLYGITEDGGDNGDGVIFSYEPVASAYTKLHDFDYTNAAFPAGSLVQASDGKLYGITSGGGSIGYGVIFSYDPVLSAYTKLRNFGANNTGNSVLGTLITDQAKKLYGMTSAGGSYGAGTIFSYDAYTSVFTKLNDFDVTNGKSPYGRLIQAFDGKLYGMTSRGGSSDYGVIFSYDPADSAYTKLIDVRRFPYGSLVQATDGKLYGMTSSGGGYFRGVIFSYDPATSAYTELKEFDYTNGANPYGSLIQASDGKLYGMTRDGGSIGDGVIFSYDCGLIK